MVLQSNGALHLFQPYIWKFKYEFDLDSIKPKIDHLFDLVEKNSKLESGDALSTVSLDPSLQPHTWLELMDFQNWLGSRLETPKDEYQFFDRNSKVINSWVNRHRKGGLTLEHSHSYTNFVASCYIKCPPGSGNIEFLNPLEYHLNSFPLNPEEVLYKEVPVDTNDVIIFPGWLKHRVQPNNTDNERIVLTINIK